MMLLPLKDYQLIWYDSSSPVHYLELISPIKEKEHFYRIEVTHASSLTSTLAQLQLMLKDHDSHGDLKLIDVSNVEASSVKPARGVNQKKRQLEEAESHSSAADDEEKEYEWVGFKSVDFEANTVLVQWKEGPPDTQPLDEFRQQIGHTRFVFEFHLMTLPPEERRGMQERMAKGKGKRGANQPKKKKQKTKMMKMMDTKAGTGTVLSHTNIRTCSYCGSVATLCIRCAHPDCDEQVCMHCWVVSASSSPTSSQETDRDTFLCSSHGGCLVIPMHPTVQQLGLPSSQSQTIGLWATPSSFSSFVSHLHHPLLRCVPLSLNEAGTTTSSSGPAAIILEYHTETEQGNVMLDEPMHAAGSGALTYEENQITFLSRLIDPAATKLVVLLTCGYYRRQLESIVAASKEAYPNTVFLLFDIPQLFVHQVQSAVCNTVQQCLLYPLQSPLTIAAEHFGPKLLQAYRPSLLFRGEFMPLIHRSSNEGVKLCACGVTLKNRGPVHKRVGWEGFERLQLDRYTCKKIPSCGAHILLQRA